MAREKVGTNWPERVVISTSKTMAVYKQAVLWDGETVDYTYIPTSGYGYVVVSGRTGNNGPVIFHAWKICRPCALSLTWGSGHDVEHREYDAAEMATWMRHSRRDWKIIGGSGYVV